MPKSKELLSSDDDLSENEEVMKIEMIKFFPLKNKNCRFFPSLIQKKQKKVTKAVTKKKKAEDTEDEEEEEEKEEEEVKEKEVRIVFKF